MRRSLEILIDVPNTEGSVVKEKRSEKRPVVSLDGLSQAGMIVINATKDSTTQKPCSDQIANEASRQS